MRSPEWGRIASAMEATSEQHEAITTLAKRLCVDAGAGSGKTRVLVERIVHLVENSPVPLEEIVAITFTEKAAAEMKERLRRVFREKAPAGDPKQMSKWRDLERRVETARISTIHAFCGALLRENAVWLGIDPDFAMLDEADSGTLVRDTIRTTFLELLESGHAGARQLAEAMRMSEVEDTLAAMLRQRGLIGRWTQRGYPFADPEALEMRWREMVREERDARLLRIARSCAIRRLIAALEACGGSCDDAGDRREVLRSACHAGLTQAAAADDPGMIVEAFSRMLTPVEGKAQRKKWSSETSFKAAEDAVKRAQALARDAIAESPRDPAIERQAASLTGALYGVFREVDAAFSQAKQRANVLDFDDLIGKATIALDENETLRQRVAREIRHLLIDEFQDTDESQLKIARLLSDLPCGPELFIVGDAKQSIYLFRGAEAEVFHEESRRADRTLPLQENFRTLPDVLEFVNHFFCASGLLDRETPYTGMKTHRAPVGGSRIEFLSVEMPDRALDAESYRRAEAALIAERIRALCSGTNGVSVCDSETKTFRPARFGDVALLFRALSNVHLYEEALRRAGIPYVLGAGKGFYTRQEVLDIRNALKAVADPWNDTALLGFLRGPMACLSDLSIQQLVQDAPLVRAFAEEKIPDGLSQPGELERARETIRDLRALRARPLPELLQRLIGETGFEAVLLRQNFGLQKTANVRKLLAQAAEFGSRRAGGLHDFIAYLDEAGSEAVREGEAIVHPEGGGAVTLLTIHKSKGLEFPIVFVPDMGQSSKQQGGNDRVFLHRHLGMAPRVEGPDGLPAYPAAAQAIRYRIAGEEEAERGRLLYVAMTRARDYLALCGFPKSGSWFELLDETYNLRERASGETISGTGWIATVHRETPQSTPLAKKDTLSQIPSWETLIDRAAPLAPPLTARNTFSISILLDHMAGGFDPEEERETESRSGPRDGATSLSIPLRREIEGDVVAPMAAAARGTLVHRLFELWDFPAAQPPCLDGLLRESGVPLCARDVLREDLIAIAERFKKAPIHARLAAQTQLEREAPFLLRVGDALISGAIDAVLDDGTLVDYKTGRFDPTRHARYEWQLLLYANAVQTLTGRTPAEGWLYYVDEDALHPVALEPTQIAWALRHASEAIAALRSS